MGSSGLSLEPHPTCSHAQAQLVEAFGDLRPVLDLQQGLARLNRLLDGAACLVVVDNVWEPEHLRAFVLLEPRCALLVTTRDQDVMDRSATSITVGLFDPTTARQLLAAWAGQDPESLPAEADEVADECGGLPLALAIAGGLVADGRSWHNVRERLRRADLDKLKGRFGDYPYPDLLRALDASVSALAGDQRDRYLELAVFEGPGGVPAEVAHLLWQESGLDDLDSEDLLLLLARRSLVQHDKATSTITLHDLQFDYVRRELGADRVQSRHARLADTYLTRWGGLGRQLPGLQASQARDDPVERYGLLRLITHLAAAGRAAPIDRLLALQRPTRSIPAGPARADNLWYILHDEAGETTAYLGDLRLARQLAEAATDQTIAQGGQAPSIGREVRYGLMSASIASIASNIPAPLFTAMVDKQLWTSGHALTYVREIPDPAAKAEALMALAPYLPPKERPGVLAEALAAALTVTDPEDQGEVLGELAPQLPADLLAKALAAARAITSPDGQARALAGLAAQLPDAERPAVLAKALAAARAISSPDDRAEALAGLAAQLPDAERPAVLAEALAAARAITSPDGQAEALAGLAAQLPDAERPAVLAEALAAARAISNPDGQARALTGLAPQLPADLLPEALAAARAISSPYWQARALAGLAPQLPDAERPAVLAEALAAARAISNPDSWSQIIIAAVQATRSVRFLTWTPHWRVAFAVAAIQGRTGMIATLAAAAEVLANFGGVDALRASSQAVRDVARWWP